MWRRFPLVPVLCGVFAAWALLSMAASGEQKLSDVRLFIVSGACGAGFALLARKLMSGPVRSRSRIEWAGLGCAYAWLGIGFFVAVMVTPALIARTAVTLRDWPAVLALAAFGGLGVLGGLLVARFRRAEEARQAAALNEQAAAFATEQLALARDLQQRLLPPPRYETVRFRLTARNVPAAYVAGDFYDFVPLAGSRMLIVIADVAGKGVAAGLIMATVKAVLPLLAADAAEAATIVRRINERLAVRASRRDFVAMIAAIYESESGALSIANAGLPDPLLLRGSDAPRPLVVTGPRYPAGIRSPLSYQSLAVTLAPNDRVLFLTDGPAEAPVGGDQLGYERLTAEVQRTHGDPVALFASLDGQNAQHDDDWTAVSLERLA